MILIQTGLINYHLNMADIALLPNELVQLFIPIVDSISVWSNTDIAE